MFRRCWLEMKPWIEGGGRGGERGCGRQDELKNVEQSSVWMGSSLYGQPTVWMGNSPATWLKMEKFNSADLLPPKRGREWKYVLNNTLKKNSLLHSEKWKRLMHPNSSLGNNTQCKCNMSDLKYWEIYSEKCILELAEYWESIESWKWKVFPGICFPNTTCSTGAYGIYNNGRQYKIKARFEAVKWNINKISFSDPDLESLGGWVICRCVGQKCKSVF